MGEEELGLPCDGYGGSKQLKKLQHKRCCSTGLALPHIYLFYLLLSWFLVAGLAGAVVAELLPAGSCWGAATTPKRDRGTGKGQARGARVVPRHPGVSTSPGAVKWLEISILFIACLYTTQAMQMLSQQ